MAKTVKEFTVSSDIGFTIFEFLILPIALALFLFRLGVVYSIAPEPIEDTYFSYFIQDIVINWQMYSVLVAGVLLWAVFKSWRVIDNRRSQRELRISHKQQTEALTDMQNTLRRIEILLEKSVNKDEY